MRHGKKFLFALALFAFCSLPVSSSAGIVYTVTESQMETWTQGLYKLKTNNEKLQAQLTTQEERLTLLQTQLGESKTAIEKAKASQAKAETSLQNLNNSLQTYKQQNEKTEKRLKRQRTLWMILTGAAVSWAISR